MYEIFNKQTGKAYTPNSRGYADHKYATEYDARQALAALPEKWRGAYDVREATAKYVYALFDNGSEVDNVESDEFATEAEAQAAGELALDGVCPRGSAHRRFYRVDVRTANK